MDREAMQRALQLESSAKSLRNKISRMALARHGGYGMKEEVIACGIPRSNGELDLEYLPIPGAARQHVFRLWRLDAVLRYNEMVRELNRLGMTGHGLEQMKETAA